VSGLAAPAIAHIERDRARAIQTAIAAAQAGDVVLIAGKGHEDYQIIGVERRYFSDRDVALAALKEGP
jgi:UDP-N-acetylmuramoyl-L-alanyl-D-glutamate--2,6-diaminopimelate ligase